MTGIEQGKYYRKQLGCESATIAWSHAARFRTALELVGNDVERLLDYGCGDGTFLGLVAPNCRSAVGADIADDQLDDCRRRFESVPNLRFIHTSDLQAPEHRRTYDVVTCMETLEHCVPAVVERVLDDLARVVAAEGRVIISVPIEIGPSFLAKFTLRKLAAWRGLSEYRYYESYGLRDASRMLFAGRNTAVTRPVYGSPGAEFHSHYGFNWRALREIVACRFILERTLFSPLGMLGGWFSSQAWFLCRPRPE